jgi:hypothetical protein
MFTEGLDLGRKKVGSVGLGVTVVFQLFDFNMRAEGVDHVLHFKLGSCTKDNYCGPRRVHVECA